MNGSRFLQGRREDERQSRYRAWPLIVLLCLVMVASGLAVVSAAVVASPLAAAEPIGDDEVPANPLPSLPEPSDDADAIKPLPRAQGDMPDSGGATVDGDDSWTDVPGIPVEVRTDEDAGDSESPSPSESPSETPTEQPSPSGLPTDSASATDGAASTAAYLRSADDPSESPTEPTDPSSSSDPTASPSASETVTPTESPSPTEPPEGFDQSELTVNLLQPKSLVSSAFVITVDAAQPAKEGGTDTPKTEAPEPSASSAAWIAAGPGDEATPTESASQESGSDEPDPGTAPVSGIDVRLSYADFVQSFGGAWSDRLAIVAYPACFVDTPTDPGCSEGVRLAATNNPTDQTLSFTSINEDELASALAAQDAESEGADDDGDGDGSGPTASPSVDPSNAIDLESSRDRTAPVAAAPKAAAMAAASSGSGVVYAATSTSAQFGANPLSPSAAWQVSEGSGEFSYSYPFSLPKAQGGQTPDLALNYSSGSVDGMSRVENGQASMAGIGWTLSNAYITRSYASCADDGLPDKGDLCWKTRNDNVVNKLQIVINGISTPLIRIDGTNNFRMADDQGWNVDLFQGAGGNNPAVNDDNNDEAFRVTSTDGTVYWFGRGNGTSSVMTVPVFGNDDGEPCYDSRGTYLSFCQQAWYWGLDRVEDVNGNVVRYTYAKETNYYSRFGNTALSNRTQYDRAGYLTTIEYGFDRGASGLARQVVDIASVARCTKKLTDVDADCAGSNGPTQSPSIWPDVPTDLICQDTGDCLNGSPSFFSTKRYCQIKTSTISGRGDTQIKRTVDTYTLGHTMPDPDNGGTDGPDLWLDSITRAGTGEDGATKSLPPVNFNGDAFANRVDPPTGGRNLAKFRITNLRNEMGGRINVVYGHADGYDCTPNYVNNGNGGDPLQRWASTKECYPQKYAPPGEADPKWEWFNKYVVTRIGLGDDALGYRLNDVDTTNSTVLGSLRVYDYEYKGDPAWRYNDDANLPDDDETWDDWRGYGTVLIHTRSTNGKQVVAGDRSVRKVTVYRGMNNSQRTNNPDSAQQVKLDTTEFAAQGSEPDDVPWLQGKVAEETLIGPSGGWLNRTYHAYDSYLTVQADEGALEHRAHFSYESSTRTYANLNDGSNVTTHEIDTTVEPGNDNHRGVKLGAVATVFDRGDPSDGSDPSSCVSTAWTTNDEAWIRVPSTVTTLDGNCTGPVIAKTVNLYDSQPETPSITKGQLKSACVYTDLSGASAKCSESKYSYDYYGRTTATRTPNGTWTTTTYDSDGGGADGLITKVTTIDNSSGAADKQFVTVTNLDPRRSQPTRVLDPNNRGTTASYDPLGRLTDVTYPGNSDSAARSLIYKYTDSTTSPSRVWTQALRDGGSYDSSYAFYDGWGRAVETQVAQPDAPDNGRIVSVTGYDDQSLARYSMATVPSGNTPTPYETVLNPAPADVPRYVVTEFDGAGRVIKSTRKNKADVVSSVETTYGAADGNSRVSVNPQDAGTTNTQYDLWGRPVRISQFNGDDTTATPEDQARYSYDSRGNLIGITKTVASAGATGPSTLNWTYGYDASSRRVQAADPEIGTSTYAYDDDGNVTRTTTPTTDVISSYDFLDRPKTSTSDDTSYAWTYDDPAVANSRGRLTSTTATTQLGTFTTAVAGYDVKGQSTGTSYSIPSYYRASGIPDAIDVAYAYNDGGQIASTVYPALGTPSAGALKGATIDAEYEAHGSFSSMHKHSTPAFHLADVTHNAYGQVTAENSTTGGTGSSSSFSRNFTYTPATGNLATLWAAVDGSSALFSQAFTYDRQDQPTHIDELGTTPGPNGGAPVSSGYCYTYDFLGRLKTAQRSLGNATERANCSNFTNPAAYNLAYAYANDRLATVTKNPATSSATTNTYKYTDSAKPHQATSIEGTNSASSGLPEPGSLTYDESGRVKQWNHGGVADLDYYDGFGNLRELHRTDASGNRTLVRYTYDADGIRLARESSPATSTWTQTGTVTTVFYVGDGIELTWTRTGASGTPAASARRSYTTPDGDLVAVEHGMPNTTSSWTWAAADAQGTVRLARIVGSAETRSYMYLPYGDPAIQRDATNNSTATGERTYLNKSQDPNGDLRLDHRSYDPSIGILTTPDPLLDTSDPQSLNPYAYSGNDPIGGSDPSGLQYAAPDDPYNPAEIAPMSGCGTIGCVMAPSGTVPTDPDPIWEFSAGFLSGVAAPVAATVDVAQQAIAHPVQYFSAQRQLQADFLANPVGTVGDLFTSLESVQDFKNGRYAHGSGRFVGDAIDAFLISHGTTKLAELTANSTRLGSTNSAKLMAKADRIEQHLSRLDHSPANDAMLGRIRSSATSGSPLSSADRAFIRHESTEAWLMDRGLGYSASHRVAGWTHRTFGNYDPSVIKQFPEYFGMGWKRYWGIE